ncbi:Transmembrane E3 ubiquitin-protein ligase 1 [Heracleum sosnowskyi]|uniref:RING-type E3 ubiquitin transferase n=1 Tax=Heracleum sosnowskyi TaxID=360622 RepID=A0AAD8M431_9APIA|nr:Transmembrane E3 ubiquitin-protein ligase 1 [Heracleum sosnowskyi]
MVSDLDPGATTLRSIKNSTLSWGYKWQPPSPSSWNITGTYEGSWGLLEYKNGNSRSPKLRKSSGDFVLELISTPTESKGVHNVKGMIMFYEVFDDEHKVGGVQIKVEGVYIWPFKQLRVAYRGKAGEFGHEDHVISDPYHLIGLFSSQDFQESTWVKIWKRKHSPVNEMEKHCNIEIMAQISRVPLMQSNEDRYSYHIEGSMNSFSVDDKGDCLQPMLLNATSVNTAMYFYKTVIYNLMVTFISFLQVLLLIRQRKHSNTHSGSAKVSILAIGQQAMMDAYLCLIHLTAGITVGSLFNAFATAAFFKFVVFAFFEMRYFLDIWKANRPTNNIQSMEARRELSVLCSKFCGIFLGCILIMYEFHKFLPFLLLLVYSFWIPQIVTNIFRNPRKPLHPYFIIGMSVTRLAIPLYIFGCPRNFMHSKPDKNWCICLVGFVGLQVLILLLQHYPGSRSFILYQILPIKYNYHKRSDQDINCATYCVICMTAVDFSQPPNVCMVTPCDHFFHSECLRKWMDEKMDCPTCRHLLPPVRR